MHETRSEPHTSASLEDVLARTGSVIWKTRGASMMPLIPQKKSVVTIRQITGPLRKWDIVLYRQPARGRHVYILHRLISEEADICRILGDNCTTVEHVPRDMIIGVMTNLYRDGREINLDGPRCRLYQLFWVRPWRLRIRLIRLRARMRRFCGRTINFIARLMPAPLKRLIKRTIGWPIGHRT